MADIRTRVEHLIKERRETKNTNTPLLEKEICKIISNSLENAQEIQACIKDTCCYEKTEWWSRDILLNGIYSFEIDNVYYHGRFSRGIITDGLVKERDELQYKSKGNIVFKIFFKSTYIYYECPHRFRIYFKSGSVYDENNERFTTPIGIFESRESVEVGSVCKYLSGNIKYIVRKEFDPENTHIIQYLDEYYDTDSPTLKISRRIIDNSFNIRTNSYDEWEEMHYFEDEDIKEFGNVRKGKKIGIWEEYDKINRKRVKSFSGPYKDGLRNGNGYEYKNGELYFSGTFYLGHMKDGYVYEKGKVIEEIINSIPKTSISIEGM